MKRSNIIGVIGAVLGIAIVVSLISWFVIKPVPTLLQGETEVTSYKASSKLAGRIAEMMVGEGDRVAKGQLLYTLETPEIDAKLRQAQAAENAARAQDNKALKGARDEQIEAAKSQVNQAQAGLDLAQKTYDRVKNLYNDGVLPAQKFDEASANLASSQALLAAARSQYGIVLNATRSEDKAAAAALVEQAAGAVSEVEAYKVDGAIYSPVDGEISTVIAQPGELVGTGYPVVTILDLSDMWVAFNIKEDMMPKVKTGTVLDAYFPALDKNIPLEVYYIAVQADFATWSATRTQGRFDIRTFNVKTRPSRADKDLRPGMTAVVDWDKIK